MSAKALATTWEVITYDVWGNPTDGYDVNDSYNQGEIELRLKPDVSNKGSENEFTSYFPTNKQIREALNCPRIKLDIESDDVHIYVSRARDNLPVGELICTSHESLSGEIRERNG